MTDNTEETEEKRPENVLTAYRDRLKTLRHAQEYAANGDVPKAVEKYNFYLQILASYHKTEERTLHPRMFNPEKDLTEMLLISMAYWDLAKAYDRSPRLQKECLRCLQQFVTFSLGFKFQHVNAQMLKKFVRSKKAHNKKAFVQALDRLNVENKSCYVATYAFPNNEFDILVTLRAFKVSLYKYSLGKFFITEYYSYSPRLVKFLENNPLLGNIVNTLLLRPTIFSIAGTIKVFKKWQ